MKSADPLWLPETQEFCRQSGIKVMGWGPNLLTVEAKSQERAAEVAAQLAPLGFKIVADDDDTEAGLLSLSMNPEAVFALLNWSFDVSRRPWDEKLQPLIWAAVAICLSIFYFTGSRRYPASPTVVLVSTFTIVFVWQAVRIWGWRLEILEHAFRIRRYFRWTTIPWDDIQSIESRSTLNMRLEAVLVMLTSGQTVRMGTFIDPFARRLRDHLQAELEKRRKLK